MVYINIYKDLFNWFISLLKKKRNNNPLPSYEKLERNSDFEKELYGFEEKGEQVFRDNYLFFDFNGNSKEFNLDDYLKQKENKFYGLIPTVLNKHRNLIQKSSKSTAERVAILLFVIVSHVGFNTFKKLRAKDLQLLLGKDYKTVLKLCINLNIIRVRNTPSKFFSDTYKACHNEIAVINRKGCFKKVVLQDKKALKARKSYLLKTSLNYTKEQKKTFRLHYRNLLASHVLGSSKTANKINEQLLNFSPYQSIGSYCYRVYSFISNLKSDKRGEVKPIYNPYTSTSELDTKASQPFICLCLMKCPHLVEYAFKNAQIGVLLSDLLYGIEFSDELLFRWEQAYYQKDFYLDFWAKMLFEIDNNWELIILRLSTEEQRQKIKASSNEKREIAKLSFMLLLNSKSFYNEKTGTGLKPLLDKLEQHPVYSGLGVMLKVFKSKILDFKKIMGNDNNELSNLKKPYTTNKNLGLVITRIESALVQKVFRAVPNKWSLILHDAIICETENIKEFESAFKATFLEEVYTYPKLKIKKL